VPCAVVVAACASAPATPPAPPPDDRAEGELRFRLVFVETADLDLYVTGPRLETVYFANSPSRIGGVLERDTRCDDAAADGAEPSPVRFETVRFEAAPAGTYRVGVDFPERCQRWVDTARFAVEVDGDGLVERRGGEIGFGTFQSRVLELDYEPPPPSSR